MVDMFVDSEFAKIPIGKGPSKIQKHGWTLKHGGERGVLMDIPKVSLRIDDVYQRSLSPTRTLRISRDWSWLACGVLTVVDRDGDFFVVDGQHRWRAAMNRTDIKDLPCLVFASAGLKMEATGFTDINMYRKSPLIVEQMKAARVSEDPIALAACQLIESDGYVFGNGPTQICRAVVTCTGALWRLARFDKEMKVLRPVWSLLVDMHKGEPIGDTMLTGLFWLEQNASESICHGKWRGRMMALEVLALIEASRKAVIVLGKGGSAIEGRAMLEVINKGLRHKLTIK